MSHTTLLGFVSQVSSAFPNFREALMSKPELGGRDQNCDCGPRETGRQIPPGRGRPP